MTRLKQLPDSKPEATPLVLRASGLEMGVPGTWSRKLWLSRACSGERLQVLEQSLERPRRARRRAHATIGDSSPCATASATVTGCVTSSQMVAPASARAMTPTTPTRLRLRRAETIGIILGEQSTPGSSLPGRIESWTEGVCGRVPAVRRWRLRTLRRGRGLRVSARPCRDRRRSPSGGAPARGGPRRRA